MDAQLFSELTMLYDQMCQALGDPKRLMILYALMRQERSVNELAAELDTPQPTVSRHLKVLRDRGLVTTRREGTSIFYALADQRIIQALDLMRGILRDRTQKQAQIAEFTALEAQN